MSNKKLLKKAPTLTNTTPSPCANAALEYGKRGWRVFPVYAVRDGRCGCGTDCKSPGKHPHVKAWPTRASTDSALITKWWQKWPDANVGIATGRSSRLIVIDVDGGEGQKSLIELESTDGTMPVTLTAKTARGKHLFFLHEDETEIRNSAGSRLGSGIDVRADKGYVVAPPSTHATGATYTWVDADCDLAAAPVWLLDLLTTEDLGEISPIQLETDDGPTISEGERNVTLTKIAGKLRAQGRSQNEIKAELLVINRKNCEPPLADEEVETIAASIGRYPAGNKKEMGTLGATSNSPLYWFPFNVNDFFSDPWIRVMDARQRGWLISLQATAFKQRGYLHNDPAMVWRWAGASSQEEFASDSKIVLNQFEVVEVKGREMLKHSQLADRYVIACGLIDKKRGAGKASAVARAEEGSL
jgi:hypothetical protein